MLPPVIRYAGSTLAVFVFVLAGARSASSQTVADPSPFAAVVLNSAVASQVAVASQTALVGPAAHVATPSIALAALHVSFGTLQAMDVFSTMRGLKAGLKEANPLMVDVAGSPGAMAAVKAGTGAVTILLTRRMARTNRAAAIVTMIAVNSAYSIVVAQNLKAARR